MPIDNGVSLPIFQPDQFTYVPWQPAANVTTFQLHHQSLAFLPPLSFDNKTLCDLNALYSQLDGELTTKLHDVCKSIAMLEPVTASTLTDVFTYLAFSLTFLHTLIFIILLFLPALFFTLKYRCHYFHRISWHSLTTTAEMLSQHRWRHLLKPISFSLLYYFWHLSLHHAYIYIQPGFPFASFSRFPSLTVGSKFPSLSLLHYLRGSNMADFVFVAEMAGFQHGDSPFYIERIFFAPVCSGPLVSFTYAKDFLLEHSDSALRT